MDPDAFPSPFASALHRYHVLLDVFEGVSRYVGELAAILDTGSGVLRNPSRLVKRDDPAYGTIWMSADDMNAVLEQWQHSLSDVWTAWNMLPAEDQAVVRRPSHNLVLFKKPVFRER